MGWTRTATDDVTGTTYPESGAREVKFSYDGTETALVVGENTHAALAALANGEGPAKLAALFAPAGTETRERKRSSGAKTVTGARDDFNLSADRYRVLAAKAGITVPGKGKLSDANKEAIRNAHKITGPVPDDSPLLADAPHGDAPTTASATGDATTGTPDATVGDASTASANPPATGRKTTARK